MGRQRQAEIVLLRSARSAEAPIAILLQEELPFAQLVLLAGLAIRMVAEAQR
jgi:hypothetical protein